MARPSKPRLGWYTYSRIMLVFRVDGGALRGRLPKGWEPVDDESGNLAIGLCQVILATDADGHPVEEPRNLYVPINGPARDLATGEVANMRYYTIALYPESLIGNDPSHALVEGGAFHRSFHWEHSDADAQVTERYQVEPESGGRLNLNIQFRPGMPERAEGEMRARYPSEPHHFMTYRIEELQDFLQGSEQASRVISLELELKIPQLEDLFDGSEDLVAVVWVPWSQRWVSGSGSS
jgi:hypothetical protein